jgi:D-3-phosphoglycerate dehydrogenase / 2-oxoglutarate reductase
MADLKSCRVLVTPRSYGQSDARLRTELAAAVGEVVYSPASRPLTSEELRELLPGCDGFIAGLDVVDRAALATADRLKVIARYGVGVDRVDLAAARERGIVVTNTPGANSNAVAELTIGLMLALARSLLTIGAATKAGTWPRSTGLSIEGKTIGLLGLGAIGKQVACRLQSFECRVLAFDPAPDSAFASAHGVTLLPRDAVVQQADFLSLHLPVLPETRGMVDAAFLARMKPGAFLVNAARGELVDETALLDSLRSGHLRGAALDALCVEPPPPDHPLLTLPQVIVTPHMGATTDGATNAMGWLALRDCLAVLSDGEPAHRVV